MIKKLDLGHNGVNSSFLIKKYWEGAFYKNEIYRVNESYREELSILWVLS